MITGLGGLGYLPNWTLKVVLPFISLDNGYLRDKTLCFDCHAIDLACRALIDRNSP